jgi:hypothetical protein
MLHCRNSAQLTFFHLTQQKKPIFYFESMLYIHLENCFDLMKPFIFFLYRSGYFLHFRSNLKADKLLAIVTAYLSLL